MKDYVAGEATWRTAQDEPPRSTNTFNEWQLHAGDAA
jgi:hypothetical protein